MPVEYPELSDMGINGTIGDFMTFPNSIYPYFWAWILGGLWLIISFTLYYTEKSSTGRSNMLSSMAISSYACMILSLMGTLIGIITLNIMIYIFVFGIIMTVIWFFSK